MNIKVIVASLMLAAAVAAVLRWRRKLARAKRYGERRHRQRKAIRHDNWAKAWLRENPARRMIDKRRYRSPNRTDQTL
jgi:hypothetical protein